MFPAFTRPRWFALSFVNYTQELPYFCDRVLPLLKAAGYLKDNRLLPAGFSLEDADPAIAPYGLVTGDENFIAGRDTLHYVVDVSAYEGPFTINFELYYQSIGYRWAENLRGYSNEQSQQFFALYDSADKTPILLGVAQHYQEE